MDKPRTYKIVVTEEEEMLLIEALQEAAKNFFLARTFSEEKIKKLLALKERLAHILGVP